jgi:hypothetical protein
MSIAAIVNATCQGFIAPLEQPCQDMQEPVSNAATPIEAYAWSALTVLIVIKTMRVMAECLSVPKRRNDIPLREMDTEAEPIEYTPPARQSILLRGIRILDDQAPAAIIMGALVGIGIASSTVNGSPTDSQCSTMTSEANTLCTKMTGGAFKKFLDVLKALEIDKKDVIRWLINSWELKDEFPELPDMVPTIPSMIPASTPEIPTTLPADPLVPDWPGNS